MVKRLVLVAALLGVIAFTANASATTSSYPTPDEAAEAAVLELWGRATTILGDCDEIRPEEFSRDVCYSGGVTDDGSYATYSSVSGVPDLGGWWVGVKPVAGGWAPYDGSICDGLVYCRQTDPSGKVTNGWPDGDVNEDAETNSLDALLVLQGVAAGKYYLRNADVDGGGGISSADALLILQDDAAMGDGLPARRGEPPFADK